eukprot:8355457-Heterocapsa_arctica.AAC.1
MVKEEDIEEGCVQKNCLTCLARDNTSGYKSSKYDMNTSRIPGQWSTMRTNVQHMNWSIPEKIDKLCSILMNL